MPTTLTLEEIETIEDYILKRLPQVLEHDPRFVTFIEGIVAEKFPRRDEFARMLDELQQHRSETAQQFGAVDERFEQVDKRFEQVDKRFDSLEQQLADLRRETADEFRAVRNEMSEGFWNVQQSIDRIGQRWGIRNEVVFRKTMREVIEKSFGASVKELAIGGEQFDIVIVGGQHILIEISASAGKDTLNRLQRKRELYINETGVTPARFIFAVGSIYERRIEAFRKADFEVVEAEEPEEE